MRKSANKFGRNKNNNQGDLVCGRLNCSDNSGVSPLVKRVMRTCFGSKPLSLAVRIIVEIRDTFLVPCSERLPKIIFLKMTRFLKLLSALLFVGSTTLGYLRKVSISSLCLSNLLRKVSVSGCEMGILHKFLNLRKMSFLEDFQFSGGNLSC